MFLHIFLPTDEELSKFNCLVLIKFLKQSLFFDIYVSSTIVEISSLRFFDPVLFYI